MYSSGELLMRSREGYFGVYLPSSTFWVKITHCKSRHKFLALNHNLLNFTMEDSDVWYIYIFLESYRSAPLKLSCKQYNQWWLSFQWNFNQNATVPIQENEIENVVCEIQISNMLRDTKSNIMRLSLCSLFANVPVGVNWWFHCRD